jgi:hypothetical protein
MYFLAVDLYQKSNVSFVESLFKELLSIDTKYSEVNVKSFQSAAKDRLHIGKQIRQAINFLSIITPS